MVSHAVSHAVSHRLITTTVNYKLVKASANRFHNLIIKIASATIFLVQVVRKRFPDLPILLGGAGGYLPDTRTPEVWAKVAISLA